MLVLSTKLTFNQQKLAALIYQPEVWPTYPFLPVIRDNPERSPFVKDIGFLCHLQGLTGEMGYSATVFRGNVFFPPKCRQELMSLPREVFDSLEEMLAAGWVLD